MDKNIVWFDLETTGINVAVDRVIEICMIKTDLDGNEIDSFYSMINPGSDIVWRQEAIDKHSITPDDVAKSPMFKHIAKDILSFIGDSSIGGYNALRFDVPVLVEEFMRCGIIFNHRDRSIIDPFLIYTKYEKRDLSSAYTKYTGKTLNNAHRAENDIRATMEIFQAQVKLYDISNDPDTINRDVNESRLNQVDLSGKFKFAEIEGKRDIVFNFGKWSGKSFREVYEKDSNYIEWMISKGEFTKETKIIAKKLLLKMRTETPL